MYLSGVIGQISLFRQMKEKEDKHITSRNFVHAQ